MSSIELLLETGDELSVQRFVVRERMQSPFEIVVEARTPDGALDFDLIIGRGAMFRLHTGTQHVAHASRSWTGICSHIEMLHVETTGLSTYRFTLVPRLWLLSRRSGYRLFQHQSVPEIAETMLSEWRIEMDLWLDRQAHPRLPLRTQYGESDLAFVLRLLEEAGLTCFFVESDNNESRLVLADRPHGTEPRAGGHLRYVDQPNQAAEREFVTELRLEQQVTPMRYTLRDIDVRRDPTFVLFGQAAADEQMEGALEQYEFVPGAFAIETTPRGETPMADDKAAVRADEKTGRELAQRRLEQAQVARRVLLFKTNVLDLAPGAVFQIDGHHHPHLDSARKWLVTEFSLEGAVGEEWRFGGRAVCAETPFRPPRQTPKPLAKGLESAVIVGPKGEEIHTDEFGRVRLQFPWDRGGHYDDASSCWVRVSQAWAGPGFGVTTIPRVGQEVLVAFMCNDPDQPVVIGRVHNGTNPVPYKLPENKTVSGFRSATTPRTGGFNELRFDDAHGQELVHVQAERNLTKLVKLDETETTGQTRIIECGKRLILTTGRASIILDGPHIFIEGDGEIVMSGGPEELEDDDFDEEHDDAPESLPPDKHGKEVYMQGVAMHGSPSFRAKVRAVLDKMGATDTGAGLFKKIRKTGREATIVESNAMGASCCPADVRKALRDPDGKAGAGCDSTVLFNPDKVPSGAPPEAVLAYALAHARMNAIGMRESGRTGGVKNADLWAIGLAPYPEGVSTENSMRRDVGWPKRERY